MKLLLCMFIVSALSCNDDDVTSGNNGSTPIETNFSENFGSQINARFLGRVINEQKEPLEGVTISVGNTITTTDAFGIFSITNASAYEKFAYITAEKDGYIKGSRALVPSESSVNQVEIMLLEKNVVATINAGETSTVNLDNGTTVTFDGGFVSANGNTYSGTVDVILKHLDPDDENMTAMMPGMLFAQNENGNAVTLETYGMLAVELKSANGEDLQLAEGSTSQISMPLASSTTNPPSTIPLWHFDEEAGYWIEEGEATLQGNMYVGEVSHFSFWNYDFPYPSIYLCITLQDENGNLLPNTALDLYSSLLNSTGTYGYTSSNGIECGLVPANEEFTLTVPYPLCSTEPFDTNIGPFSSDTNITVTVESQDILSFTGNFLSCNGDNVTNGYVQLFIDGLSQVIPIENGNINYTVYHCNASTYSIKGVDVENNQITDLITGVIDGETIDLGAFSACITFEDSDNDGVFDTYEDLNGDNDLTNDDTDQDGIPNYLDEDDDNDGINTIDENYDGDNDPANDDIDGDGIPNYLDDNDVGIFDFEMAGIDCNPVLFDFDLMVNGIYTMPNTTYTFYQNEADAIAGSNAITTPSNYTVPFSQMITGNQMIFVKGTNTIHGFSAIATIYLYLDYIDSDQDGLTDCEEITGIDDPNTFMVATGISDPNDPDDPNIQSEYPQHGTLEVCDDNIPDGVANFDLHSMDYYFSTGILEISISYYQTEQDALFTDNPLVSPYTNTVNPETLFVRIEDADTGEIFQISTLTLVVNPLFEIPTDLSITECDGDGDDFTEFNLDSLNDQVLQGATEYTVTYHEIQADAEANVNPIPATYTNIVPGIQIIFIRVEHMETGCYNIGSVDLIVDSGC
ncbi:carboxypeptidase-like regulatory domain-containing protein [Pontimicrobium sp. IMCC45349]|uniref:carboxypeptidase-like regulatory domain-containing protein n=1 Tax=Pontimicrobium sp. IMCC45349 TaxID=3391574 RepID=UPI00399F0AD5